jgi:universal stress protein A
MKIKPVRKSRGGGVIVEMEGREHALPPAPRVTELGPLPMFRLRRILVPVDFSDCSRKALQYALPFAKEFEASLILLHVVSPFLPPAEMSLAEVADIELRLRESGLRELESLRASVAREAPVETALRVGRPDMEIVRAARELDADVIVLSTHGRTGLAHMFMGSTAEQVVRRAGCPVFIVRQREHEFVTGTRAAARGRARGRAVPAGV